MDELEKHLTKVHARHKRVQAIREEVATDPDRYPAVAESLRRLDRDVAMPGYQDEYAAEHPPTATKRVPRA